MARSTACCSSPPSTDPLIADRKAKRLQARSRFTTANRQRKSNANGDVHRLAVDKNGNHVVIEKNDDLLEGGDLALAAIIGERDNQWRLF